MSSRPLDVNVKVSEEDQKELTQIEKHIIEIGLRNIRKENTNVFML